MSGDTNTQGETKSGIPNFTEGEMSVFMALAEAMKEVDRLRGIVIALGSNPDLVYTSDSIDGMAKELSPAPEGSKSE